MAFTPFLSRIQSYVQSLRGGTLREEVAAVKARLKEIEDNKAAAEARRLKEIEDNMAKIARIAGRLSVVRESPSKIPSFSRVTGDESNAPAPVTVSTSTVSESQVSQLGPHRSFKPVGTVSRKPVVPLKPLTVSRTFKPVGTRTPSFKPVGTAVSRTPSRTVSRSSVPHQQFTKMNLKCEKYEGTSGCMLRLPANVALINNILKINNDKGENLIGENLIGEFIKFLSQKNIFVKVPKNILDNQTFLYEVKAFTLQKKTLGTSLQKLTSYACFRDTACFEIIFKAGSKVYFNDKNIEKLYLITNEMCNPDPITIAMKQFKENHNEEKKIFQNIAPYLAFLHKDKISHKDIKPDNIVCCKEVYKLIDYGSVDHENPYSRVSQLYSYTSSSEDSQFWLDFEDYNAIIKNIPDANDSDYSIWIVYNLRKLLVESCMENKDMTLPYQIIDKNDVFYSTQMYSDQFALAIVLVEWFFYKNFVKSDGLKWQNPINETIKMCHNILKQGKLHYDNYNVVCKSENRKEFLTTYRTFIFINIEYDAYVGLLIYSLVRNVNFFDNSPLDIVVADSSFSNFSSHGANRLTYEAFI